MLTKSLREKKNNMIHIIGANGYIGANLVSYLKTKKMSFKCYSDIEDDICLKFDLKNPDFKVLEVSSDDVVVLLAAISSPDICRNNYHFAYSVNVSGTSCVIDYCLEHNCKIVFLSSDTVNGGTDKIARDEYSEPNPFGKYAEMKYEIEKKYKNEPLFKTLRLSYVFSSTDKFSSYLHNCIVKDEEAEVFDGLFRSVVTLDLVLEAIYNLCIDFFFNGYYLINVSGNQLLSRKDLAEVYKKSIDGRLKYKVIETPKHFFDSRPNIIFTKSLFLEKLVKHKINNLL